MKLFNFFKKDSITKITNTKKRDVLIALKCLRNLHAKYDTIETIVLGDSNARYAFIEDKKSINFGIDSQDLYYSSKILEKYKNDIPNLKNVVLFCPIYVLGNDIQKNPNYYRAAYYSAFFDIPYKNKYLAFEKGLLDLEKKLFKLKSYAVKNLKTIPYDIMTDKKQHREETPEELDFYNAAIKISKNLTQTNYIKNIIKTCMENDFKLVVVLTAYNPRIKQKGLGSEELFKNLIEIINSFDYKIHIYNAYDDTSLKDEDFIDFIHLNLKGAKKITSKINEFLE